MKAILVFSIISFTGLANGLNAKSENVILERPFKPSKGLLEKPDYKHVDSESSEETDAAYDSSWLNRAWENAFGGRDHSGRFLSPLRPWWKGPNVCQLKEEYTEPVNEPNSFSFLNFFMTSCHDSRRAYKCTKRTRRNGTTVNVHTLTYECCLGYERDTEKPSGCQKKVELQDVLTTLRGLNTTKLVQALQEAKSESALEQGNVTLFAPSDDAMNNSDGQNGISVVVLETEDKMQFPRDILNSHVVSGSKYYSSDDFEDEMVLQTLSDGATIRINFATANCARITSSDHQTTNGYIHVINRVLSPIDRSLWQLIENDQRFSVLRSLMDDNLKRRLSDPKQHLTLLAFTDDAFDKLSADIRQQIQDESGCFKNLLLHHLLPHTICSAAVYNERGYVRNLANRVINATRIDGVIAFAGRKVTTADQMATNGVMQIIDGAIIFPDMLDVLNALQFHGDAAVQFASALKANDLSPSLAASTPVTVFVPPPQSIPSLSRDDILNHVVRQSIFSRNRVSFSRSTTVTTEAGKNMPIQFRYDFPSLFHWNDGHRLRMYVGCAQAERISSSCNGTIVFLNKALYAPMKTVYDSLKSQEELADFVSMLDSAKLADELRGSSFSGTVLVPTNQALAQSLTEREKKRLMENPERLQHFLKQHMLRGTRCCHELTGNSVLVPGHYSTMAGTKVTTTGLDEDDLRIGGAPVRQCDLSATNGLVHVVNGAVASRRRWQFPSLWTRVSDLFDDI